MQSFKEKVFLTPICRSVFIYDLGFYDRPSCYTMATQIVLGYNKVTKPTSQWLDPPHPAAYERWAAAVYAIDSPHRGKLKAVGNICIFIGTTITENQPSAASFLLPRLARSM